MTRCLVSLDSQPAAKAAACLPHTHTYGAAHLRQLEGDAQGGPVLGVGQRAPLAVEQAADGVAQTVRLRCKRAAAGEGSRQGDEAQAGSLCRPAANCDSSPSSPPQEKTNLRLPRHSPRTTGCGSSCRCRRSQSRDGRCLGPVPPAAPTSPLCGQASCRREEVGKLRGRGAGLEPPPCIQHSSHSSSAPASQPHRTCTGPRR